MKTICVLLFVLFTLKLCLADPISGRIVGGGNVTSITDHPYMVSIQRGMNGLWQHICGGAIITDRTVLTAASCFGTNFFAVFRIRAGILNYNDPLTIGQTVNVYSVHIPQQFSANPMNALENIAVLILSWPLTFTTSVRNIPTANIQPIFPLSPVTLVGWGSTANFTRPQDTTLSRRLQYLTTTAVACIASDTSLPVNNQMIMCSRTNPTGSFISGCTGDLGSPLISNERVVGIVARYQRPCGNYSTVYTNVFAFNGWINNIRP